MIGCAARWELSWQQGKDVPTACLQVLPILRQHMLTLQHMQHTSGTLVLLYSAQPALAAGHRQLAGEEVWNIRVHHFLLKLFVCPEQHLEEHW